MQQVEAQRRIIATCKRRIRGQLGLPAAIAVVTGEAIALGIFLTPAAMAKSLGSPLLLGLVWLGIALMAMCGALSYSELAIRFPESGGEYVYLRAGYGENVAFLYGWIELHRDVPRVGCGAGRGLDAVCGPAAACGRAPCLRALRGSLLYLPCSFACSA